MKRILIVLAVLVLPFVVTFGLTRLAVADGSGSGSAVVTASTGSGSAIGSAGGAQPSDKLADPVKDPAAAIDDAKAAKKQGWPILILVVLIALTKAVSYLPGTVGKWFATGKRAMLVAGTLALLTSLYNAVALGGSWYAAGLAAVTALIALLSPHAPTTAQDKHDGATA